MGRIFLSSDLHFMHNKEFVFGERGYSSIEEHDENVIRIWNETVNEDDQVIVLGDIYMGADHDAATSLINRLNGNIILIRGNHCTDNKTAYIYENCSRVAIMGWAMPFRYRKYNFYLSHYPCLVSNHDDNKSLHTRTICLCGHSHVKDRWADWDKGLIYHCEWDAHGKPVLLDDIIEEIKEKIIEN